MLCCYDSIAQMLQVHDLNLTTSFALILHDRPFGSRVLGRVSLLTESNAQAHRVRYEEDTLTATPNFSIRSLFCLYFTKNRGFEDHLLRQRRSESFDVSIPGCPAPPNRHNGWRGRRDN